MKDMCCPVFGYGGLVVFLTSGYAFKYYKVG